MSSIHYKFRSNLEYNTITFDSQAVSLNDLRDAIMLQKKIAKSPDYTLEITNAQTKEVYNDDDALIPKNSSVIVKRVPIQRLAAVTDKSLSKEEEELTEIAFAQLSKTADLAGARASEDDKILAMMSQSGMDFDPSTYLKRAPPNYVCFRCGGKGHFIKNCPTQGDARYNKMQITRQPSGIPREYYLMKMKQEEELIASLRAMQDENSRFSPVVGSEIVDHSKVPSELQCPMCKKLFTDVVVTPCCGESYCDECIRTYLVENDIICKCGETTSPDNLIANKSLRISVSNFRNQKKELKTITPSLAVSQPIVSLSTLTNTTEAVTDFTTTENSGALANGIDAPNIQVTEAAVINSPKKFPSEPQQIIASNVVSHVEIPQIIGSIPQHILSASQALFPSVSGAIYTQSGVSGYVLPQPRMLPGVVGLSIPPGATIIKRLVPVPVGPRIGIPAQSVLPPQFVPHQPLQHLNQGMLARISLAQKSKELRKEPESPMPLTEDEFYMWQSKIKKHDPRSRHRHRSSSRDHYRSRSRSPYYRNHSDSPVSSSQERKKKNKTKRRHHESSHESGCESSSIKRRSRSEKRLLKSTRFVPDHIKRELDEFEFDNEIEFDEEMRNIKGKKVKVKKRDSSIRVTKKNTRTSSFSKPSSPEGEGIVTKLSGIDLSVEPLENKQLTVSELTNEIENVALQRLDNLDQTVLPKRKTRLVKKKIIRVIKKVVPKKKLLLCNESSAPTVSSIKIDNVNNSINKVAVLREEVALKEESLPEIELNKIEPFVSAAKKKTLGKVLADSVTDCSEKTSLYTSTKSSFLNEKSKVTEKNIQVSSNDAKENKPLIKELKKTTVNNSEMPENSRWQNEELTSNHNVKSCSSPVVKTSAASLLSIRKLNPRLSDGDVAPKRKISQCETNLKKRVIMLKSKSNREKSKAEEVAAEVLAKKEAEKLALAKKVKKASASFRKDQSGNSDIEEGAIRRKRERREKYLLAKERKLAKEYLEKLKAAKKDMQKLTGGKKPQIQISCENSSSDEDGKNEKRPDQEFYKPGEKLKSISEMSKKRLQQEDQMKSSTKLDEIKSDVLKSKVSSLTVITVKKSNERVDDQAIGSQAKDSRRVVCIDGNKRSLSSEVALLSETKLKNQSKNLLGDSLHHLGDESFVGKRLKPEAECEKRWQLQCEAHNDDHQNELKPDKIRQEKSKIERSDLKRVQELERERQLAVFEKEQLEKILKKERKLRENMEREAELKVKKELTSSYPESKNKSMKVNDIEKSVEEEDTTDSEVEKKSNKKKSKRKKDRKRKRKREVQESEQSEDSEDSSVDCSEGERKKKKKKKKHKSKHKKHRKSKKHRKKNKKKKSRKDSSDVGEEESNDESVINESVVVEKTFSDEDLSSSTDINQKDLSSDSESEKSSSSSACEKRNSPIVTSSIINDINTESNKVSKKSYPESHVPDLFQDVKDVDKSSESISFDQSKKASMSEKVSSHDDDIELDYNEDIGAIYENLDFGDDEQSNSCGVNKQNNCDEPEEGELLEDDIFVLSPKPVGHLPTLESDLCVSEPNDRDIENAVDNAINEQEINGGYITESKEEDNLSITDESNFNNILTNALHTNNKNRTREMKSNINDVR